MSIHDGHRQRLKKRFQTEGLDNFEQVHVLELLLCYCIPRKDTNPVAHRLLERFGSFSQVLDASAQELAKVEGMGTGAATFLELLTASWRYYQVNRALGEVVLTTLDMCGDYMLPYFYGRRNEMVYLLCLDAKCKVITCREVGEGSINSVSIPARKIVEIAMGVNASSVVLAHNHPSGVALPSQEDILTTRHLAHALQVVDIELLDHIVVADDDYVSMVQSGCFDPRDCGILI